MNKQNVPALPDEIKIEELLGKIQPVPSERFHQKMKRAAWRVEGRQPVVRKNLRLKITFAMIAFAALTVLFATPQGRAWAQEVFQFFRRVNFTTIPVSEREKEWMNAPVQQYELSLIPVILPTIMPEMTSLAECQAPQNIQSYACQVAYAEAKLRMDLMEFPKTPEGWIFKTLNFDTASKVASFVYTHYSEHGGEFILRQGEGDFQNDYWDIVPVDKVETVKVGLFSGEYVLGQFTLREGDSAWMWTTEFEYQRLAWGDGQRWYYMEIMPPRPDYIARDQLVELAASLVNAPTEIADPLNPDSLSSIADAEQYSGLDLKAPTLLPWGYDFSYARYFSFNNEVHLHYKLGEDLVVYEWQGKPDNFEALGKIYKDHEIVKINGKPAFYGIPEAVSQYESSYLFLAWQDETLNYRIYFYFDPAWGGGMLDKEKMIAIAESMDDINDYRRNDYRPYEYVAVYEKASGFDAKEFPTPPEGWSFTGAGGFPGCISLSYSATNENGTLTLTQCKTDQTLLPAGIPSRAIEQVKIGESAGQYILGNFDYDNNGMMIWKPNSPSQQVFWQADNLQLNLSVSGDSVVLLDKEDLISYAESLR